jgi:hypothetical protein
MYLEEDLAQTSVLRLSARGPFWLTILVICVPIPCSIASSPIVRFAVLEVLLISGSPSNPNATQLLRSQIYVLSNKLNSVDVSSSFNVRQVDFVA